MIVTFTDKRGHISKITWPITIKEHEARSIEQGNMLMSCLIALAFKVTYEDETDERKES